MMTYGSVDVVELTLTILGHRMERRDEHWYDVELQLQAADPALVPESITELGALLVCTADGLLVDIAAQDEGRDCEYQFTESEKEQLRLYFREHVQLELTP
ncbi:hypothetical protein [Paenibacillus sp. YYML68]|uniref:hypothetical protein n=1 Tax=Paenibacillus sp. YYML68 TaxID=2909250 RepID=UPI0024912F4A|nr:hypothetical protein [Paenibacillus sp. YYML68]